MSWTVACFCGCIWHGQPPDACPQCGVTISDGIHVQDLHWLTEVRDEIGGPDSRTPPDPTEAW